MAALARSRAYGLLGDLHVRGLTAETLVAWRQADSGILGDERHAPIDLDAAAESHTRLYALEIPPYEGAFLSADGLLGGEIAESVRAARALAGLADPVAIEPDHLGAELAWLGFLCGAEADALRDGFDASGVIALERAALQGHLLRWVPAYVAAVEGAVAKPAEAAGPQAMQGHPIDRIYLRGARITLALLLDHHRVAAGLPVQESSEAWALPPLLKVLDNPQTGLRGIAEHLVLPCQAGGYLSRGVIVRVARTLDLPATFGTRADLLEGLLCAAAQYSLVPEVCEALATVCQGWSRHLADAPPALVQPWLDRIAATEGLLQRLLEHRLSLDGVGRASAVD